MKYNINKKLKYVMIKQAKQLKSLDNTITNDDIYYITDNYITFMYSFSEDEII